MNMDCAACGKSVSVTAKFCGKCGAPVKRSTRPPEAEAAIPSTATAVESMRAPAEALNQANATVNDLVISLTEPNQPMDHSGMLDIDLNLDVQPATTPAAPIDQVSDEFPTPTHVDWLPRLEQQQAELKKTLEKHSLLLDFISLASQQQTHHQSQPNPTESLLHEMVEKQTEFALQLTQLQNQLSQQSANAPSGRIPEEWKLLLEKQKVEIQKAFTANVTQIADNMGQAQAADLLKMQDLVKANAAVAESMQKNLAPLTQTVTELKKNVLELTKKVESQFAAARKLGANKVEDSDGGSLMIFIIGLLCGLTVVLSSLAIYNFLGHSSSSPTESLSHPDSNASHSDPADHAESASGHSDNTAKPKSKAHPAEGH